MIRRDFPRVLAIENECFERPWTEDEFIRCLRQRYCIGMVACNTNTDLKFLPESVTGFMIYELHPNRLELLKFAVGLKDRGEGVGRAMVEKLVSKLSIQKRTRIQIHIRESNLPAQLFFRSMGFRCTKQRKNYFDDTGEDAYKFVYRVKSLAGAVVGAELRP